MNGLNPDATVIAIQCLDFQRNKLMQSLDRRVCISKIITTEIHDNETHTLARH